ncbi:VP6 protein [Acado virus]|nr:VP6 protein [Acado virus]
MTRVLLLAPGDLILRISSELKAENVNFEVDEHGGFPTSEVAQEGTDKSLSRTGPESVRDANGNIGDDKKPEGAHDRSATTTNVLLPSVTGGSDKNVSSPKDGDVKNVTRGDAAVDGDKQGLEHGQPVGETTNARGDSKKYANGDIRENVGSCSDKSTRRRGRDVSSEEKTPGGDGTGNIGETMVLTKIIAAAIQDYSGMEVSVFEGDVKKGAKILHLSNALGKFLGLSPDAIREQTDVVSSLKKKLKKDKIDAEILRVESEAKFQAMFPTAKKADISKVSGVGMVTNKLKYVSQASVMFTAPTGDPGWKEVSRAAMKRDNIRAYVHDPAKNQMSPHEALLTLIRSL